MVDPDVTVLKKKGVRKEGLEKEGIGKQGVRKQGDNQKTGVIVGIGTRRDVSSNNVVDAVKKALAEHGLTLSDVELFASATIKENESGLIEAIFGMGGQIVFIPAEVINSINVPSASEAKRLGLNGVCEPCALALSRENKLIMKKKVYDNVTIAIAQ
ncbi:MAG: cobalamin biosynthesis protein [Methanosarcinales archaeon]|nr:cobalamin biosynthesis protein [Methanosarcinales archaeon]